MKLFIMQVLYYWGNLFLYKADKILCTEAGLNNINVTHVQGARTKRIMKALEAHNRLEDFFKKKNKKCQ